MAIKNKKILITAGATWVPIDRVRVISNIATGKTGILLAEKLAGLGAKVTLMLGPSQERPKQRKIRLIRFKFFGEFRDKIIRELESKRFDTIIHSAAVSDFRPAGVIKGKLSSDKPYTLRLVRLPKIIRDIRRLSAKAKLVIFKLECSISDTSLIKRARDALGAYRAELAVANSLYPRYKAFIVSKDKLYSEVSSKEELVNKIIPLIA